MPVKDPLRNRILDVVTKKLNGVKDTGPEEKTDEGVSKKSDKKGGSTEVVLESLTAIFCALVDTTPNTASMNQILKRLELWIVSTSKPERLAALKIYRDVCKRFMNKLRGPDCIDTGSVNSLKSLGHLLATLIPRTCDADHEIRQYAMENIQVLLFTDQLLREPDSKASREICTITEIRHKLVAEKVADEREKAVIELSQEMCKLVSPVEMVTLLSVCIRGVNDCDPLAARGTAKCLQGLLFGRANEMRLHVDKLGAFYLEELSKMNESSSALGETLRSICILAREHFEPLMQFIFRQKLPVSDQAVEIFRAIAKDKKLKNQLIDYLDNTIITHPVVETYITPSLATATSAFVAILEIKEIKPLALERYDRLLSTLLSRIGTASGKRQLGKESFKVGKRNADQEIEIRNGKKVKSKKKGDKAEAKAVPKQPQMNVQEDAVKALRTFFTATDRVKLMEKMDDGGIWRKMQNADYEEGLTDFAGVYCDMFPDERRAFFKANEHLLSKHYGGQKCPAVTIYSEIVQHSSDDVLLLCDLVNALLPRVVDKDPRVRKNALVGIGNVRSIWCEGLENKANAILQTVSIAVEDKDAPVAAQAIKSLTAILNVLSVETVSPHLNNICHRTRPFFDNKSAEVREATFVLFATLCLYGEDDQLFTQQIHNNMVAMISHMNDPKMDVCNTAHKTIKTVAKFLEAPQLLDVLKSATPGPSYFDQLLHHLVPVLVELFRDHINTYLESCSAYLKSTWPVIRGNAACVAGKLISSVPEDMHNVLPVGIVLQELMSMLTQKQAEVRARAAKALSFVDNV